MTPPSPTRPDGDDEPLNPQLAALAAAILDGGDIDWASCRSGPAENYATELRIVANLAGLHRSLPFEPDSTTRVPLRLPPRTGTLTFTRSLGSGSFGEVFRAWDSRLQRDVAVKVLFRDRGDENDGEAFLREGRLLAKVRHPNVITVHGAELMDGRIGLITEFVDGRSLSEIVRAEGPLPVPDAINIGLDLSRALTAVHHAGLLHRDIKPQNVMRQRDGRIVLMDFGAGHHGDATGATLAGTPLFLAPEVLAGQSATAQSDLYSQGVLLYFLLTGAYPVEGASLDEIRGAHAAGRRVPIRDRRGNIPRALAAVIDRATAPDPATRFDTAAALEKALQTVAAAAPAALADRRWWSVAAVLLAATVAGIGWLKWTPVSVSAAPPRWILVSAFENHTGDARLGPALQLAFEQELMQSRGLTIVPRERLADTLRLMKRPIVERVDPPSAREVSLRDGEIPLYAAARIDRIASNFTLKIAVNDTRTAAPVLNAGIEAPTLDGILERLKPLAAQVRAAVGESRRRIDEDARLEQATTASFEALASYTSGMTMVNERRWAAAEAALRDAVTKDPDFASALIMLSHAIRNQQRPETDYLPFAQRAFALSAGLPPRERYFIVGSYHTLLRDHAKSLPVYELLAREYPNDFWGVNNLLVAYDRAGKYREAIPLQDHRLSLRPRDWNLLAATAQIRVITTGDLDRARALVARAEADRPSDGTRSDILAAWLRIFPVFDLWAQGRVFEAASRLDSLASEARLSDAMGAAIGTMNVTLGRLRAAEDAFQTMSAASDRQELLAYAAIARDDIAGARAALFGDPNLLDRKRPAPSQGSYGKATLIVWTMIRAGLVDEAAAFAGRGMFADDPSDAVRGLLLAARGETTESMTILENARRHFPPGNPQVFLAAESQAELLVRRGDLRTAEEVLLQAGGPWTAYPSAGSRGYIWLRLRARLLEVARQLGHTARAQEVERELREFLAIADPDFALRRYVR